MHKSVMSAALRHWRLKSFFQSHLKWIINNLDVQIETIMLFNVIDCYYFRCSYIDIVFDNKMSPIAFVHTSIMSNRWTWNLCALSIQRFSMPVYITRRCTKSFFRDKSLIFSKIAKFVRLHVPLIVKFSKITFIILQLFQDI